MPHQSDMKRKDMSTNQNRGEHTEGQLFPPTEENERYGHTRHTIMARCDQDDGLFDFCKVLPINGHENKPYAGKMRRANERRLAACWNACQGVDTEELERTRNIGDIIEFNAKGAHEQAGLEVESLQLRVTSLEGVLRKTKSLIEQAIKHGALNNIPDHSLNEGIALEFAIKCIDTALSPSGPQEA